MREFQKKNQLKTIEEAYYRILNVQWYMGFTKNGGRF